jgi:very-short-patch-repair endonuclease
VAGRHGIVTRSELVADGFSIDQIRRLVRIRSIVNCHTGTYRLATPLDTFESRCAAACISDPTAVITGRAAAALWGCRHIHQPKEPILLVGHNRNPLNNGVTLRRTNVLGDEDRVRRTDGIVVASPPRTWFDCGRDIDDETFEATTEWVLDRHASQPTLWRTVRRLDGRGRPGLARVRRVLSQRSNWQRPAGSKLELRVLRALLRAGVPELVRQHRLRLPNDVVIHPDGAAPWIRWAVEVDHITWHGGRADAQRDKSRDRGLRRIGWQVERVTDQELRTDFSATIDELADRYHRRAADLAA